MDLKNKCLFVDRDGILNEVEIIDGFPHPPKSLASLVITPCARDIIARVTKLGYYTICVSNQPDIARGTQDFSEVVKMNNLLLDNFTIDDIYFCPHDDEDNCNCRKPKIGMFEMARSKYKIDLSKSFMLGDTWRDIYAGNNAGCKTIFLDKNYEMEKPKNADYYIKNIEDILEVILNGN